MKHLALALVVLAAACTPPCTCVWTPQTSAGGFVSSMPQAGMPSPQATPPSRVTGYVAGGKGFDSTSGAHRIVIAWRNEDSSCSCDLTAHDYSLGWATTREKDRPSLEAKCRKACAAAR